MIRVAFAFGFVGILLPFIRAYSLNIQMFHISFFRTFITAMTVALLAGLGAWLAMNFPNRHVKTFMALCVLYFVLMAWFFLNFFPGGIGYLDGHPIAYDDVKWNLALEGWLFTALIPSMILYRNHFLRYAGLLSVVVCVWSLASIAPALWEMSKDRNDTKTALFNEIQNTDPNLIKFSNSNNIILFILDTFQTDVVKMVLLKEPELLREFKDFVFYQNNASAFSKTSASVPAILTGKSYDNSEPIGEYLKSAYFQNGSLPLRMKSAGFDSRIYASYRPPQIASPLLWDNILGSDHIDDLFNIGRLAAISVAPTPIKAVLANELLFENIVYNVRGPPVYSGANDCDSSLANVPTMEKFEVREGADIRILGKLINCSSVENGRPKLRVFHLQGAHQPFYIKQTKNVANPEKISLQYARQVEGTLYLMAAVMDRLKDLDVYRNAAVLIVGDHGAQEYLGRYDDNQFLGDKGEVRSDPSDLIISASLAALLYKPPNQEQKELLFSDIPTASTDVSATLLKTAGVEIDAPTLSDFTETSDRIRYHSFYTFQGWDISYIEGLRRYSVRGPVWDRSSWSVGQPMLPPSEDN